ncbi:MAG: hypothetical protein Q8N53_06075 [Longimicrobiales bacterium]|nr:hypothetical protein [Longimicrobiales bacterium]
MKAPSLPLRRAPLGVLLALVVVSSCVDAPSAPEGGGGRGLWVMALVLSLVGPGGERPMTAAQGDALSAAFDRVNRCRMVIRRAADNVVVRDTVIEVTPGAEEYDLSVPIEATSGAERAPGGVGGLDPGQQRADHGEPPGARTGLEELPG